MRPKTYLKKWYFIAMTLVMLVCLMVISTTAVSADSPPLVTVTFYSTLNDPVSYVNIFLNNDGIALQGWCVSHTTFINMGQTYQYPATLYDYFGRYYQNETGLPTEVRMDHVNWHAVAYIINNRGGYTSPAVQDAIWYFVQPPYNLNPLIVPSAQALVDAANNNLNFVPGPGQKRPIIIYVNGAIQPLFFEYQGSSPAYPTPELPAGALLGLGLAGIGGFIFINRRRKAVSAV